MKIIKKILLGFLILIVLIISAIGILPVVFKDDIVVKVKEIANESVNAQVDFGDFDLSIFSTFPNFLFEIENVSVVGKEDFEGDTLAYIGSLNLELDLNSVMNGDYTVTNFQIKDLVANATVLENGKASWDIAIPDTTTVEEPEEEVVEEDGAAANFGLKNYSLENVNIKYIDLQGEMLAEIKNLNHSGSFAMNGDKMDLATLTSIDELTYGMENVKYANKLKTEIKADLGIDLDSMKFVFKENKFSFNKLNLGLNGWMQMGEEDMDFDIELNALENKFEEVLSLLPSVYKQDIAGIETKGDFSLKAFFKGKMVDDKLPSFGTNLQVKNAYFKYPDLPESVDNINIDLNVYNKTGVINDTYVDLNKFACLLAKNPIDFEFHVNNVEVDPNMRGRIQSKLNLENLGKVVPMEEGEEYKGRINADLKFAGKLSDIENEKYENFDAKGNVKLMAVVYKSEDLPETLVKVAEINFSPQYVTLDNFETKIGKSDVQLKGKVENFLPYVFNDETIKGELSLNSNYLNLDEIMGEDEAADSTSTEEVAAVDSTSDEGAVEVPANIDFVFTSAIKKLDYDNMPITNYKGNITVRNSEVKLDATELEILGGHITLDGKYNTQNIKKPFTGMKLNITGMDIPTAFNTFNSVQTLAPIAKDAKGEFTLNIDFTTLLTDSMTPNYETMQGKGDIFTKELLIENSDLMTKIADALKNEKLKKMRAEDLKIFYTIKDGKVFVEPFDMNLGTTKAKVSGWNSFDQTMKYKFAFKIPRKDLGGEANKLVGDLESQAQALGAKNFAVGEFVNVDVFVEGPMDNPMIKVGPAGIGGGSKSLQDQAKDQINKEIDKAKADLEKKAQEEKERLEREAKEKLEAEQKRLEEEAKKKLKEEEDRIKREAEEKAKKEVENKAKDALKGFGF